MRAIGEWYGRTMRAYYAIADELKVMADVSDLDDKPSSPKGTVKRSFNSRKK